MTYKSVLKNGLSAAMVVAGLSMPAHADTPYSGRNVQGLYSNVWKLEQNWTDGAAQWYYHATQGSQLVHYDIFLALEMADSQELLKDAAVSRFGYFSAVSNIGNPDMLPVGFAKDDDGRHYWVGMTCAACHTGRIEHGGRIVQIDGAPTLADLSGLIDGISKALKAAKSDPDKRKRFIARALGNNPPKRKVADLMRRLDDNITRFNDIVSDSYLDRPANEKVVWGHGRTDAFGMIFNRVSATDLKWADNRKPPNAPVSYPHIWDTGRFDWVQWNAVVPNNNGIEKLFRNAGEVLGVFGTADLRKPTKGRDYYKSSVKVTNLLWMEDLVEKMSAPRWTEMFGALDPDKVKRGGEIYNKSCIQCHQLLPSGNGPFKVGLTKVSVVGTDPVMAQNALRMVETRQLEGVRMPPAIGSPLKEKDLGVSLLGNAVIGSVLGRLLDPFQEGLVRGVADRAERIFDGYKWVEAGESGKLASDKKKLHAAMRDLFSVLDDKATPDLSSYKARPLDGIWATAPFLHNGSVPNLWELLQPSAKRSKTFNVGSIKYDPKLVGYVTSEGPGVFDTSVPGNSNAGHEGDLFGTTLSDEDRWALIEYLKSL